MRSQPRYIPVRADILWLVGVVAFHYAGMFLAGKLIPEDAIFLDWSLMAIWFSALAAIDLVAVILLLGTRGAKFLTITMYCSCAWSIGLAVEAVLSSDSLIQLDRYAQVAIFIAILASLAWGVRKCWESRPPLS